SGGQRKTLHGLVERAGGIQVLLHFFPFLQHDRGDKFTVSFDAELELAQVPAGLPVGLVAWMLEIAHLWNKDQSVRLDLLEIVPTRAAVAVTAQHFLRVRQGSRQKVVMLNDTVHLHDALAERAQKFAVLWLGPQREVVSPQQVMDFGIALCADVPT